MQRSLEGQDRPDALAATDAQIADMCRAVDARRAPDERMVASGIAIFEELGFVRVEGFGDARHLLMTDHPGHMALTDSIRYLEGLRAKLAFSTFRSWALTAPAHDMLARVRHPITPGMAG